MTLVIVAKSALKILKESAHVFRERREVFSRFLKMAANMSPPSIKFCPQLAKTFFPPQIWRSHNLSSLELCRH